MTTIHPTAAEGFSSAAAAYERGRPGYPAESVDWLVERLGISASSTVLDLAAGTGKLTRMLVPSGARVVAVEPVAKMRSVLTELVPGAVVRDGTAEAIPMEDGSADVVTVAQAFHWFNLDEALPEIHRVLKPAGTLALVWNRMDATQPLQNDLEDLLRPYRRKEEARYGGGWRKVIEASPFFSQPRAGLATSRSAHDGPGSLETARFDHTQRLDRDGVVDRISSISYVATLPEQDRAELLRDVQRTVARETEPIALLYSTEIYLAQRL